MKTGEENCLTTFTYKMRAFIKNIPYIVLINILLSLYNVFSEETWRRYSSKEGDGTLFTTRHSIFLEHLSSMPGENVDWCYPVECSLKNKSFSSAILHCPKPGFHPIGPITSRSDNQSVRHINIIHSPFYYEWYLAYNREPRNESVEEFRLWIVDQKQISECEKNGTALFPSQYSKELTGVFFQLGQRPFLKLKVGYRSIDWDEIQIYSQSFNTMQRYWKFSVDSVINHQVTVWIDGHSVALHDRFIRRSSVQLLITKFNFPVTNIPNQAEVILTGSKQHKDPFIVQDPCAPHVAVLISSKCLLTQDNFATAMKLKVPSTLLVQSEAAVKMALFSAENIIVLLESGRVLVFNGTAQTWGDPLGLPQVGLTGLASQKKCFEGANNEIMRNLVLGWSNETDGNRIYLSKDSGVSFQQLYFPTLTFSVTSVFHVDIHCFIPIATFLVNTTSYDNQEKTVFMQYDFMENAWTEEELNLPSLSQDPPISFSFIPPSTLFLIAWNKKLFAFGKLNETGSAFKVKKQENLTDFILEVNETIVSVITGGHGDFAVHLSNNRLFYGRAFGEHVVEIFAGEEPSSSLTLMFDIFGSLLLITNEGEKVKTRKLPLKNEVLNAVFPQTSCPYLKFTTSVNPDLYFMDKGDEKKVWAVLIYPRTAPNDIRLEISNADVLQITSEGHVEHYKGIVTLNKTFTFKYNLQNGTSLQKSSYKSTAIAVQLLPKIGELTCENTFQVLHVHVGCPPLKRIAIRNCTSQTGVEPVPLLSTDYGQHPCRLNAAISESIKFVVDLYEGNRFVEEVHTDYVVWEETGRTEYGYTATMSEAGCLSEAQTWRKLAENTSEYLSSIWTQNNYQNCFKAGNDGKAFDGSQPYEILNSTGVSQLVFQGSGNFQFQLRVVGTHLSFCELTTRFSVQVTGSEGRDFLPQIVSVIVVTLVSTVLLYISFAQYTKRTLNRHQEDEEEQQRLQELKSLFSSFQQGADDAGISHRRSTSHNVRRFTGTAMLMTNRLPQECLADAVAATGAILESTEPSRTSLRSRKSSHTNN